MQFLAQDCVSERTVQVGISDTRHRGQSRDIGPGREGKRHSGPQLTFWGFIARLPSWGGPEYKQETSQKANQMDKESAVYSEYYLMETTV